MEKRQKKSDFFSKNQRGLSNIITTLLIIVLVLVAVGAVWNVARNIIESGAEQIELGKFTLDLEIKSVKIEGDDVTVDVIVKRNPGLGEFIGIYFVFSDGQNSEVIREDTVLDELEERSFTYTLTEINTSELVDVSIAPIYELKSGKEDTGNIADKFDLKKSSTTGQAISESLGGNFEEYGPVGAGKTEYTISSGEEEIPEFTRIIIDPLDVKIGDMQTFTAYVTSPNEITEVTTRTQLDNEILILPLEKTDNPDEYIGIWQVYDTHSEIYRTNFTAKDSAGNENTVSMSWTDPCTSLSDHGTTTTISSPCSVSVVDGVDVGNIIVASGGSITLNSGGVFVYTPGYSVSFSGSGKLIKSSGGALKKAYLYYTDADGDLKGNGYAWSTSSSWSGHTRANSATSSSDCLDSDADVYQNIGSLGLDVDNDRYTTGSSATRCVGSKSSFWYKDADGTNKWITTADDLGTGNDCLDSDADVYRNVASLILDADQDRYSTGSIATRCVGSIQSTYWYKDADATYKWIYILNSFGTDCNDNNALVLNLAWSSGVSFGTGCIGPVTPASGACAPVTSTYDYYSGSFGNDCFNNPYEPEPEFFRFRQTCNFC